jgi:SAM-dependent methyltransferase
MTDLLQRLTADPLGFIRRAFFKLVHGPLRYRTEDGYDAERYWRDRLKRYGPLLKGPGDEGLSESDNRRLYDEATATLLDACSREGVDFAQCRVLEVGCGNGIFTRLCRNQGVIHYTGMDVTDALFVEFRGRFPGYEFVKGDITRSVPSGKYDLVLVIDVLEHITTDLGLDLAMNSLRNCLNEDGTLVVALPISDRIARTNLFYLRFWTQEELFRRLGDLSVTQQRPFRLGTLYTLCPARTLRTGEEG